MRLGQADANYVQSKTQSKHGVSENPGKESLGLIGSQNRRLVKNVLKDTQRMQKAISSCSLQMEDLKVLAADA